MNENTSSQWINHINQINEIGSPNCFQLYDARIGAVESDLSTSTTNVPYSSAVRNYINSIITTATTTTAGIVKIATNISSGSTNNTVPTSKAVYEYINNNDNNTTYTFTFNSDTNKFTATPSNGTAQIVTITPFIATATTTTAGLMSSSDKTKLNSLSNYTLTSATSNNYGGIKIGYTQSGKNYPVQLTTGGQAYVNVPWESGSSYTLPKATASTLGGVTIGNNINVSDGKISITSANIINALGYTPPTINTTYSASSGLSLSGTTFSLAPLTSKTASTVNHWTYYIGTSAPSNTTNVATGALCFQIEL